MSKYANTDAGRVCTSGGSVRVTIASTVGQGNGGTSLPVKRVWLITNATDTRVNIGSACTATTGIPVPVFLAASSIYQNPLEVSIDDVSSLYFFGTNDKVVDILYAR